LEEIGASAEAHTVTHGRQRLLLDTNAKDNREQYRCKDYDGNCVNHFEIAFFDIHDQVLRGRVIIASWQYVSRIRVITSS
jgi:hypothetical protein